MNQIQFGDCRTIMDQWISEGVKAQTCVTSPPYFGLRDYGTSTWLGGDANCKHEGIPIGNNRNFINEGGRLGNNKALSHGDCVKCGAVRQDSQIGLEQTVGDYVAAIVGVFKRVRDLLSDDGTLWLNLGDSYYNYRGGKGQSLVKQTVSNNLQDLPQVCARRGNKQEGLKEKDLIGIPWRVAFALQEDGWYLRQDIIWHKPNPMPESVKDRCTKSHEYIFLLTKNPKYYFDNEAIKEPVKEDWGTRDRTDGKYHNEGSGLSPHSGLEKSYEMANKRSVWTVTTKPFHGAHFATFPTDLIEPCILAGSRPRDIVFDPFMGSGTSAAVAQRLNRQYLGCELNTEYKKLQDARLSQQSLELL
jgi:DNA modification methylase